MELQLLMISNLRVFYLHQFLIHTLFTVFRILDVQYRFESIYTLTYNICYATEVVEKILTSFILNAIYSSSDAYFI